MVPYTKHKTETQTNVKLDEKSWIKAYEKSDTNRKDKENIKSNDKAAEKTTDKLKNLYLAEVYKKIFKHAVYPAREKQLNHFGSVVLEFKLLKTGFIKDINFTRTCSYSKLNQSAMKAVQKARPFDPIPDSLKINDLNVIVEIRYEKD
ncbi:TonB family protein [Thermoproteota archaeon]